MAKQFIVPVNETNEIRIRHDVWKGEQKIFIQVYWKPGPSFTGDLDSRGFAFGKAVTVPVAKFPLFIKAVNRAAEYFEEEGLLAQITPKRSKKGPKIDAEEVEE